MKNFSLQLWTVDKETTADFKGTLKAVSEMGYTGVEFAGFKGIPATEMKSYLDGFGLNVTGAHIGSGILRESLTETLEYNAEIGNKYIIVPAYKFDGEDSVKALVELLNNTSVKAAEYGIKIGFHNHSAEFNKIGGRLILDIIAEETSADVIIEPDVYWIKYASGNPYEYVKKLGKKAELVHLKQIGLDYKFEPLFRYGLIDMGKIV